MAHLVHPESPSLVARRVPRGEWRISHGHLWRPHGIGYQHFNFAVEYTYCWISTYWLEIIVIFNYSEINQKQTNRSRNFSTSTFNPRSLHDGEHFTHLRKWRVPLWYWCWKNTRTCQSSLVPAKNCSPYEVHSEYNPTHTHNLPLWNLLRTQYMVRIQMENNRIERSRYHTGLEAELWCFSPRYY